MYRVTFLGDYFSQTIENVKNINFIDDTVKIKLADWREEDNFYLRPQNYKNIKTIEIEVY